MCTKLDASEAALATKTRTAAGLEERVKLLVAENEEGAKRREAQDETRRQAEERLTDVERRLAEALAEITRKDLELETARSEVRAIIKGFTHITHRGTGRLTRPGLRSKKRRTS